MKVLVNGVADAQLAPLDRGLQYGDGLFETIAVCGGRPRFFDWHRERLAGGCARLGLQSPDGELLAAEISRAGNGTQYVAKLLLTRGSGGRGYRPDPAPAQTRIVAAFDWPAMPHGASEAGVRVRSCQIRLARNAALAGIKHLNRLEQVMARREWDDPQVAEGLMFDDAGHAVCGTQTNLFAMVEGTLVTPLLDQCGVAGVMRRAFLGWVAGQGETVVERRLMAAELQQSSELLLTNALIGAWPVRELDGRALTVGSLAARFNRWLESS